jgi:hypothetical protein
MVFPAFDTGMIDSQHVTSYVDKSGDTIRQPVMRIIFVHSGVRQAVLNATAAEKWGDEEKQLLSSVRVQEETRFKRRLRTATHDCEERKTTRWCLDYLV